VAARGLAGPRPTPLSEAEAAAFADRVEQALYASKIVSYTQGFHEIAAGSEEYGWDIDLGAVSALWRGGCIIRAAFLDRIRAAYDTRPDLPSLLSDETFAQEIAAAQDDWREVLIAATRQGVPAPGFAAALAYYDALRADRLPAALTQGQRDYFGAHTYRRTDREGSFHTLWGGDRTEVEA
jgi:6-phosphogluconate dehydrogenase